MKAGISCFFLFFTLFSLFGLDTGTVSVCSSAGPVNIGNNNGPSTGVWSVSQGSGTFADNQKTTTVTNIGYGTNIYHYTIAGVVEKIWTVYNSRANAGTDILPCVNIANVTLNGNNPADVPNTTGQWTCIGANCAGISFNNATQYNTTVSGFTSGNIYTLRWTVTTGAVTCTSSDDVLIDVNPSPSAVLSGTTAICNGQSTPLTVNFAGSAPYNITYTDGVVPASINGINSNPYSFSVSPTATRTYSLQAVSDSKCNASASDLSGNPVVTVNSRPTAVLSGTNIICNGQSSSLTVNFTGTGPWNITYTDGAAPVTINNINANPYSFSVSPTSTKTYSLTAASDSKCSSIAADLSGSATVTVTPRPTVTLTGTSTICEGQSSTLTLNLTGTGPWNVTYTDGVTPVVINNINANPYTFTVSPTSTQTYTVTAANDSKCTSIAADLTGSAVVTVTPRPTADISGTNTICQGFSTNLLVNFTGASPWNITYTDGVSPVTQNNINANPYTISVSPTVTRTYSLTALSDSRCASIAADRSGNPVVTVTPRPTVILSGTNTICLGQSTLLTLNFTGTGPWDVTYSDGVTPFTINNINANPYTFSVSPTSATTYTLLSANDSKCASIAADLSGSAVVTVNPRPTAVLSGTATICNGQSATLSVAFTGTGPWNITYTDGVTPVTINGINANPYTFAVSPTANKTYVLTDASDSKCTSIPADLSGSAVITVNLRPTAIISGSPTICNGQAATLTVTLTGSASWGITYTDGITPVTINNINVNPYTFTVSPSSTKTYTLSATNDSKCASIGADLSGNSLVTVNPRPTAVLSGSATICNGQSANLSVTFTGVAPWSITYTDGGAPVTLNNIMANPYIFAVSPLVTKTYSLTAASDSRCSSIAADLSGTPSVTVVSRPTAVLSGTNTVCNGQSAPLTVSLTGGPPWSITYTDGALPVTIPNINVSPHTFQVSPTSNKTYTLTAATDNSCVAIPADLTGSASITVNPRPTAVLSGANTICSGQSATLTVGFTGTGPWNITYTDGATPVTIAGINANPYSFPVSPTTTQTYTLSAVSDSKCTSIAADLSGSALITVNPRPTAIISGTTIICNGQSATLTIDLTGTGPWSVTYTDGVAPVTVNNINATPYTFAVSPSSNKTYTLTAASDSKCTSIAVDLSGSAMITVNPRPTAVFSGSNTICNGQSTNLSATFTGSAPWSITYTDGITPVIINNINANPFVFAVSPTSTKTYTLSAVNDSKCSALMGDVSGNAIVTVNDRPTAVLSGTTSICNGQTATLTITFSGTAPWSVTYTDGAVPVTVNGIVTSVYSFTVAPGSTKTYSLVSANDSKCAALTADLSGNAVITVNTLPTAVLSGSNTICNGQSATLNINFTGSAPWTVTYTDGAIPVTVNNIIASSYSFSVSPSSNKTYSLISMNDSRCVAIPVGISGNAAITVNPRQTAVLSGTNTICQGQTATLSVAFTGTAPWNITYTDGTIPVTVNGINSNPYTFTVSPNAVATYTLTAGSDSKCAAIAADLSGSAIINVNQRPTVTLTGTPAICNGQTATLSLALTGTAPWSVSYTDGVTPVTINNINASPYTFTVSPASTTTYTLTAASDSKCASIAGDLNGTVTVTVDARPTAVLSGNTSICNGQSANLSVTFTGVGPWSITYTDGVTPVTVNNINTNPYTFAVSPTSTKTYTLTSVSGNCSAVAGDISGSAIVNVDARPTAVLSGTTSICEGQTATLTVTLTGSGPWNITYTDGSVPVTVNGIVAGVYLFTVSPTTTKTYTLTAVSDNCSGTPGDISGNAIVTVNTRPTGVISGSNTLCNGQSATLTVNLTGSAPWSVTYTDGTIPVTVNNINTTPYTFSVSPATTRTYTLTAVNDSRCSSLPADMSGSAIVTVNDRPTATLSGNTTICYGQPATLTLNLTGSAPWNITYTDGVAPVSLVNINVSPYTFTVSPSSSRTYSLTALNDSRCFAAPADLSGSAAITVNQRPTAVISGNSVICNGQSSSISIDLTGSAPWSITYSDGITPVTVNNINASPYTFSVSPTSTKTYTVTAVSDTKCSALAADMTGSATVTVNARPTVSLTGSTTCVGQSASLTLALTGASPWSVTYTDGITPVTVNNIIASPHVISVSPLTDQTYTLTAANDTKCNSIAADLISNGAVVVNTRPTAAISGTTAICNGQSATLTLNFTGSAPWSVTYSDGTTQFSINNINTNNYTFSVSPTVSRTYTLVSVNDGKCTSIPADLSGSAVVTVNPRPTAALSGTTTICNGQSAMLSISFSGTAPWSATYTDGTIPVTVNNILSSPYTFTINPTTSKTYTLTSVSDSKCSSIPADLTSNAVITVNPRPTVNLSGTNSICYGQTATLTMTLTGSAPWDVTYTDGITPVTVTVNASPYSFTVSPIISTTYTLTSANDSKCTSLPADLSGSATVTINSRPTGVLSGTTTICNGQSATLTVALTGTAPWNITYTDGITPVTINNINASPYTFSVTPGSNKTYTLAAISDSKCTSLATDLSGNAVITINARPTGILSGTTTICNGQSATLTVALTGTGPWNITYTDGITPVTINSINASPYTFTVTPTTTHTYVLTAVNDNYCNALPGGLSGSAIVNVNQRPTAVLSGSTNLCNGLSATLTLTFTGSAPWNITYTDGTTPVTVNNFNANPYTFVVSPTSTTTYSITSLNDSKCAAIPADLSGNTTVTVNPRPTASISGTSTICNGQSATLTLLLTGTAPWSVTFNDGVAPTTINNILTSTYTFPVTPGSTKTYTLTSVNDSKCSALAGDLSGNAVITVNSRPTAVLSGSNTICFGQSATLSLILTGTAPWNVTYTDGVTPVTITVNASPYTFAVSPSSTRTYTITTVSDSKCVSLPADLTGAAIVTVNPHPTVALSGTTTLCEGQSATLMLTLTGKAPWNVTYTDGVTPVTINNILANPYTFVVSPISNKTYTLTAANDSKCASVPADLSGSAVVSVNTRPTAVLSGTTTICNGQSATLTVNLTGTAPWSVTYSDGLTPFTINNINTSLYTFSVAPSSTRTYTLASVSDSKCNSIPADLSGNAAITVNPRPTAVLTGTNTICNGQSTNLSIAFTGTGPWNVTYTDGTTPVTVNGIAANPYTFAVSPSTDKTYSITSVSDSKCAAQISDMSGSAVVTVNPRPTATISGNNTICNGQFASITINLTGTAPWSITYTDGGIPVTVNNINTSTYTFTVSPTSNKTYTLTALSDSKCTSLAGDLSGSAIVTVNPRPTAVLSGTSTICSGGTANLTLTLTGTAPWNVVYSDGVTPATITNINVSPYTINVSPTSSRTYTLVSASDSKCSSLPADMSGNPAVTVDPRPTAVISGTGTICNGQSATLTLNLTGIAPWNLTYTDGGAQITINNILSNVYTFAVSPTSTRTYTITALSDSRCTSTATDLSGSAVITVNQRPTASISGNAIICNGQSTNLTLNLTGTGPWNVTYSDGITPITINAVNVTPYTFAVSPTTTRTYTITGLSDSKCTSLPADLSGNALVTVNPRPTVSISGTTAICNGQSATLSLALTGTAPWSVTYTDGTTSTTLNNINASPYTFTVSPGVTTTYTVTAASDSRCTAIPSDLTGNTVITVNTRPTAVLSGTNTICNGQSSTITLNLTGTAPWNVTYTDGTNPFTINNINSNSYTFTVSPTSNTTYSLVSVSDSKCSAVAADMSGSATITVNPRPTGVIGNSASICSGDSAQISIALTGSGPWNLTYSDGSATSVTGASSPYTFKVSPASTRTYTITALSDTKCSALAGDLAGSATITIKPLPNVYAVTGGGTFCEGAAGVPVGVSNSTVGVNYELYLNNITTGLIVAGTNAAITFGNQLLPGTYTVKATIVANSCSVSMNGTAVVVKNPLPQDAQAITGPITVCPGSAQSYSVPPITNATTYVWSLPANATISSGAGTNVVTVLFALNTPSGNISVYGKNACGDGLSSSHAVTVSPLPAVAPLINGKTMVCQAEKNVIYSIASLANATSYTWTVPAGGTIISGQGTTQILVDYGAAASSGNITVTGNNSCGSGATTTLAITVVPTPQLTLNAPSGQITCSGATVTLSATSSTFNPSFLWTAINGGNITSATNLSSITVSTAGDYIITVTEPVNSCITKDTVTVISDNQAPQNVTIAASNAGEVTCLVPQITLTAATTSVFPVSYQWIASSGGNITAGGNTATPTVNKGGIYEVRVTNLATSCFTTRSFTVTELKTAPDITVTNPEDEKLTCSKLTATLNGISATSGATYSWVGPGIVSGGNTGTPIVNIAGTYTLTITAPNGCSSTDIVQVQSDLSVPTVTVNTNPGILTCTNTTVTLNGSSTTGGATLLWKGPGVVSGAATQTPVVNQAGTYTLVVTHPITGCKDSATVTVTENIAVPTVVFPIIPSTITCALPNVTITSSTSAANKTYLWSTVNGTIVSGSTNQNVVVSKASTYTLLITDTDNGCSNSSSITTVENTTLPDALIAQPGDVTCAQPAITLTGFTTTTPVNIAWTTADGAIVAGTETSLTPSITKGGTYVMTVTNTTTQCKTSASVFVVEKKTGPAISIDKNPSVLNCATATVLLNGTSAGSSLLWTGPAGATIQNPTSTTPRVDKVGRYYLTATNVNGCSTKDSTDVPGDVSKPVNLTIAGSATLTCSVTSLNLTGNSTTPSATYQWSASNGGTIISASNASSVTIGSAGDYKMVVTHPLSFCKDSTSVTINQDLSAPTITFSLVPVTITCTQTTSTLNATVLPAGSALLWTGPGNISNTAITNPVVNAAGTYTLKATHPTSGCTTTNTLVVPENKILPDIAIANPPAVTCTQPNVPLDATTSVVNYTAQWTTTNGTIVGATNTIDAIAAKAGLYTLTLTNNVTGCITSQNVLVADNTTAPNVMVDLNPDKITCTVTQVELFGSSSTVGATLLWTGPGNILGPTTQRPKVDAIGPYVLTVTGTNGCKSAATVNVTNDLTTPGVPGILPPAVITCTNKTVNLEVSPLPLNVDYLWTTSGSGNISNATTATATVDAIGTYTVKVTDRTSGCSNQNSDTVTENKAVSDATIVGGPYEISCSSTSIQLEGSSVTGINPVWTASSGGHIVSGGSTLKPLVDAPGTYTFTVTNPVTGCTNSSNVIVTKAVDLPGLYVDAFPAELTCAATQVTLNGYPTEAGTTFQWIASPGNIVSGGATSNPIVDQPGTYILKVTKTATGCINTAAIEVKQNTATPQVVISVPQQFTCSRTQVQLNGSSPDAGVSPLWTTSGAGSIKAGDDVVWNPVVLTPATYTLTVTNLATQCTSVQSIVVTQDITPPLINVDKSPFPLTCTRKQVLLSGTSLTPGATFLWTTAGAGNISNPASKTPAVDAIGTYTLTVTNPANGCTISDNVAVLEDVTAPQIWVNSTPSVLNCIRDTVQLKGSSTTSNVSYLWTGPGNISNAAVKEPFVDAPGVYNLTVTDAANGCTSLLPVTVLRNLTIPATPLATGNYSCFGTPATSLSAAGNAIQWYNNPVLGTINKVGTGNNFVPSTLSAANDYNFYATQTDAISQCESPASQVTYTIRPLPATPTNVDKTICQGDPNTTLQAFGNNIKWYNAPGGAIISVGSFTPALVAPGSYTYYTTQTDAFGCESPAKDITLTIQSLPAKPTVNMVNASVCFGNANPTFSASGNNLKWYSSPSLPAPVKTGGLFTPLETAGGTYSYYVTQTSNLGCVSPYETVTLTINPLPQAYTVTGGGVICENTPGLAIGLSGSQLNTSYQLLLNGTTVVTSLNGTGNPLDFGLQKTAGNYSVLATAGSTCQATMTGGVSITSNPLPGNALAVTGLASVCEGSVNISYSVPAIANATSYTWNIPAGSTIASGLNTSNITLDFPTGAVSGQVTVFASNACGQGAISPNLQVIVNPLPAAAGAIKYVAVNNKICLGDSGVIYEVDPIANATSYEWILPAGATIYSGNNSRQIRVKFALNSAIGNQTIRVRGVNNCGAGAYSAVYAITVYPNPTVYAGIDQNICANNTTLQGSAIPMGGAGIWTQLMGNSIISNNSIPNSSIAAITQGTNTFIWKVTNNGCSAIDTVKIYNNQLTVDAGQNLPICLQEIMMRGSTPPSGTSGIWTVASGSASFTASSQPNTKASNFGYGDNKLYWTVTKTGCESRDSITITNYRPSTPDAGPNQTICTNRAVLAANLPTYGVGRWALYSGQVTFADVYNRNSAISMVAKGKNVLTWSVTNQICNLSDTVVITNNELDVNAGYDQLICDNRTTLDGTPPLSGTSGQWSVYLGSASFLDNKAYNSKISGLVNGPNKLVWSITRGICTNSDTVTVVCNMPTAANAGPDQFLANGNAVLDGNQPIIGTGKWSIISGAATFANSTLYNTAVSGLNPGANLLRWTITYNNCSTQDDVTITNGTIEKVDAGQDQIICTNQTQLEAARPQYGFGIWTVQKGAANFEDNEQYNTKVTNLSPGTNILRWSVVVSGIEFYDTVSIINNEPTLAIVGPRQILCNDSSMLTGNFPTQGTGKWTLEGGAAIIANINQSNSKVTKLGNGDNLFRWTITKGACTSSSVLTITNDKTSVADAGLDQTLCDDKTTLIPSPAFIGTGEWNVVSGSGRFTNNDVSGLARGKNILRWTIRKNNCSSSDDVTITCNKPTAASAGMNAVVCVDSMNLSANRPNFSLGEFGRWSLRNGSGIIQDSTLNTSLIKGLAEGKNVLRWSIDNNGCISSSEVEIDFAFVKSIAGAARIICDNHVLLNANNPGVGIGEWSIIGGSGTAVFVDPRSPNTEVKNLDRGKNILRWSIRNQTCNSSSEVTITNNSPSDAYAGGDQNLCTNTYTLDARPTLIGKGSWSVLSGAGSFADTSAYNSVLRNIGAGTNTYRWTVVNGNCVSTDEVVISNDQPINTSAGINQTLCVDSTFILANQPVVGIGVWSIIKGAGTVKDAYSSFTKIQKLAPDTNIIRWTVTNKQCSDFREIKLINNQPTIASAGADITVCSEQTMMDGNIPKYGTGEWSVISGSASFTNKTLYNSIADKLSRGKNIFRWKISKQTCTSFDDVSITNDLPTQPDAGTDIAVCDNNAPLNANKPLIGKGYWSVFSGKATFTDSTKYNSMVVGLGQGSNILKWTITNNKCSLYDIVEVKNNQTSVFAGPDQTVFEPNSMLVANEPPRGIGIWSLDAGTGIIASPNSTESFVSGLSEGANTFVWSVNIDGCISSDRVIVTYYKLPTASFSVNQTEGCPPLRVNFTKTTVEKYPFKWEFGDKDSSSTTENPSFIYDKPGIYSAKLTVTGPDGKQITREKKITVHDLPTVKFETIPKEVYIPDQELRCLNYTKGGKEYLWKFGDGETSSELNSAHIYKDSGFYNITLVAWSEYQCVDSLVVENAVHVIEKSRIKFPSAFTPNPNGSSGGRYERTDFSNDVFYPIVYMGGIQEYKMEIFNRWGVLLFESNNIEIGWDGYYKGKLLMQDVYIYRVSGIYNDGKRFNIIGDVLLMRR